MEEYQCIGIHLQCIQFCIHKYEIQCSLYNQHLRCNRENQLNIHPHLKQAQGDVYTFKQLKVMFVMEMMKEIATQPGNWTRKECRAKEVFLFPNFHKKPVFNQILDIPMD